MTSQQRLFSLYIFFLTLLTLLFSSSLASAQEISFSEEQVINGKSLYREHCQTCHGTKLSNGQFGSPLKGSFFRKTWAGKSVGELVTFVYDSMPPESPKSLEPQEYAEIMAFVLENNRVEANGESISGDFETLNQIPLPW